MSSQWTCEMIAAAIRAVWPRDTMKLLARSMDVPLDTARHWLYREMSAKRRRELALALLAEMDAQEVGRSALRRRLAEWAGDVGVGDSNASVEAGRPGAARGVGTTRAAEEVRQS